MSNNRSDLALTRRTLLAGMAAFAARPAWAALPSNPDVVIIGAGSAGIAAALKLQSLGKSVVIVEAADRIGGRAFTDTATFGIPFDIGCAWIHAADRNPLYQRAIDAGYHLQFHELDLDSIFYGRRKAKKKEVQGEIAMEDQMVEEIGKIAKAKDIPSDQAVDTVSTPTRRAAATYLGPMDMGVDLDELSTTDYANSADLDPNYLTYEGYGSLMAKIGAGLPVKLSTPALGIHYGAKRGVRVDTPSGTIEAKAAIVTVSTGVLGGGAINFDPMLPDWKETAIAEVPMGLLAKIPLLIRGDRMGAKPFEDILIERPGRQDLYFLAWPFNTDLMVGFVGGDFGWQLSAAGDDAAIDFAKQGLRETFGSKAPAKVEKALFTHWASNPLTRGAYAAAVPGRYAAREALGRPLNDRVFFAGEALAGEFIQTCGGAFMNGEAVAETVTKTLG